MATVGEFLHQSMRSLHGQFDQAVGELTPEQLHWLPDDTKLNHIGCTLWHYVRTEDNVVQFILQDRKPTVWIESGFFERFGLHKIAQGTGMTTEDAHALRLPPIADWMEYQRAVWQATDEYLANIDDAALDEVRKVVPFGELSAWQALSRTCLTHGHAHFGEICVLRVLQGLPSSVI